MISVNLLFVNCSSICVYDIIMVDVCYNTQSTLITNHVRLCAWSDHQIWIHEDGGMNEMTLPSRHRIRNSDPGGLRPSTLDLGHGGCPQYWNFTSERGINFCFFECRSEERTPRSPTFQAGSSTQYTVLPIICYIRSDMTAAHILINTTKFTCFHLFAISDQYTLSV